MDFPWPGIGVIPHHMSLRRNKPTVRSGDGRHRSIETKRLILRQFRASDFERYAEMCADAEVMQYLGGLPMTRTEAWRNLATVLGHWELRGYGLWAVEQRSAQGLIGRVGCWRPEGWPGLELAWTLRRDCWGQGYATEAARAAMEFAFLVLRQRRVISLIHPANSRSIAVALRLGMQPERSIKIEGHTVLEYGVRSPGSLETAANGGLVSG